VNQFKFALQDLWRHKGTSLILLIETILMLAIINLLVWSLNDMTKMKQEIERLNRSKEIYGFMDYTSEERIQSILADDTHLPALRELYNGIYNNSNIEAFPLYSADIYTVKSSVTTQTTLTPKEMNRTPFLYANHFFFEYFNINLNEGRLFDETDYTINEVNIPIIIGSELQSQYELDQVFTDVTGRSYKVIGILDEGSSYIDIMASRDFKDLDRMFILPQNLNYLTSITELDSVITRAYMATEDESELSEIVRLAAEKDTYSFAYKSMRYQSQFVAQDKAKVLQTQLLLSGLILIFTFVSVNVSYLQFIKKYTYDFGVHLLSGATIKHIMLRIAGQFLILLVLSNILYGIFFSKFANLPLTIAFSILTIVMFLTIPLMRLHRTPMRTLLRRKQQ